jgi:L-asparagine transporter-like permease
MSLRLFWRSFAFWITILVLLTVVVTVMPAAQTWPRFVPFVLILMIALGQIWYIQRKQRTGPE